MNEVLEYFLKNKEEILCKNIHVYGWQNEYDYLMVGSCTKYLFEDFKVIENLAPLTNPNRPGVIKPRYYVCVHDTGDADPLHTAKFWSEAVKKMAWEQGSYECSYQYVVGNDGIYHNIPDNEVAWHAGDTTKYDYKLYEAGLTGVNPKPVVSITDDGYYSIDGAKSIILAPRIYRKNKDGVVTVDRVGTDSDFNSQGVLCKLIDGKYYIGETYYSSGYGLIANRGGNNNSIGIESCINEGSDIHLTWQRTAKLVSHLLKDNNLTLDDIKQHHYFSGKNCPQTMRMNGLWDYFLSLVKCECDILKFLDKSYKIELIPLDDEIASNGRIKELKNGMKFVIRTTLDDKVDELEFSI